MLIGELFWIGFYSFWRIKYIPEMIRVWKRIWFSEDRARPSQVPEREYASLPQDHTFTTSLYFSSRSTQKLTPISKRTSGYYISKTFAQLFFPSDFSDIRSSFITLSSPPLVLWFIQAPICAASSLGILLLNHCDFHQMIRNTKQSWLMLLCSQILISRWFVLPSSLVCKDRRGSSKISFVCLEPNKELTCLAQYLLQSVWYLRRTINFMVL